MCKVFSHWTRTEITSTLMGPVPSNFTDVKKDQYGGKSITLFLFYAPFKSYNLFFLI